MILQSYVNENDLIFRLAYQIRRGVNIEQEVADQQREEEEEQQRQEQQRQEQEEEDAWLDRPDDLRYDGMD